MWNSKWHFGFILIFWIEHCINRKKTGLQFTSLPLHQLLCVTVLFCTIMGSRLSLFPYTQILSAINLPKETKHKINKSLILLPQIFHRYHNNVTVESLGHSLTSFLNIICWSRIFLLFIHYFLDYHVQFSCWTQGGTLIQNVYAVQFSYGLCGREAVFWQHISSIENKNYVLLYLLEWWLNGSPNRKR